MIEYFSNLKNAGIAQPVEQLIRNQQVMCSSHTTSSMKKPEISVVSGFFILEAIADDLSRRQAGQQDKLKSCLAAAFQKSFG